MRAMRVKVTSHLTLSTIPTSLLTRPQPVSSTDGKIERRLCSKLSSNFSTKIENERFVYLVMGDGTSLALLGRNNARIKCISQNFADINLMLSSGQRKQRSAASAVQPVQAVIFNIYYSEQRKTFHPPANIFSFFSLSSFNYR